jgi:Leucine-rich repeat (LRR) protein
MYVSLIVNKFKLVVQGPLVVEELKKAKAEVRELVLENANIIEIGPRAFNNLRIKRLVLDNNKIRVIQKNAFRGLEATLQDLSIGNNRMMVSSSSFIQFIVFHNKYKKF